MTSKSLNLLTYPPGAAGSATPAGHTSNTGPPGRIPGAAAPYQGRTTAAGTWLGQGLGPGTGTGPRRPACRSAGH